MRDSWTHERLDPSAGNAHEEILTGEDGFATFTGVPKGIRLRVKVLNRPMGAVRTHQNQGGDDSKDSDLGDDDTSDGFDLATFSGSTFVSRNIGFLMPRDMEVRVWDGTYESICNRCITNLQDSCFCVSNSLQTFSSRFPLARVADVNGNGIQDSDEIGISDVILQLVNDDRHTTAVLDAGNGGNAHEQLVTDQTGVVRFTKIPKGRSYRVRVVNRPLGAIRTTENQGEDQTINSNLSGDTISSPFNLCSFEGDVFRGIGLGYRMPSDMVVRIWDDLDGNGLIDEGEPGVRNVDLHLVYADDNSRVESMGEDSTAHLTLKTDTNGFVTFRKAPKGRDLRVVMTNVPNGSTPTSVSMGTEEDRGRNSDLDTNNRSIPFRLDSFVGAGAFGEIALGLQMPKTVVVRVWHDKNRNGIQDEGEPGIQNVQIQLIRANNGARLPNIGQSSGSTAHLVRTTDADGRASWNKVHRGISIIARVTVLPANIPMSVSPRNQGTNRQLDSDAEVKSKRLQSVSFTLPSDVTSIFDMIDLGIVGNF